MSDRDFVNKFLVLATINKPELSPSYQKPLREIKSLGVALPPLKYKYNPKKRVHKDASSNNDKVKLTLKSVRPPKLSLEHEFNVEETVLQVKEFIKEQEDTIKQLGQLKLLVKGKVLHDSTLLVDLPVKTENVLINVMVSKPVAEDEKDPEEISVTTPPPQKKQEIEVPWSVIKQVLVDTYPTSEEAANVFQRLQKGYDLTK
ncbi:ubiquitin-like protein Mdy2p [Monosporozyma unispora]|nr:hypothetical protein C6P44_005220 [Kazachstania unispora]